MVQMNKPLAVRDGVEWVEADGEILLLDLQRGHLFSLNDIGSQIWKYLVEGFTVNQVIQSLRKEFNVEVEILQADAVDFIKSLMEKGIVLEEAMS